MPIVTVQVTREGTEPGVDHVTPEQKAAIYEGVSRLLYDVLKKPPEWTWVIFQEVAMEDWGWGWFARRRISYEARHGEAGVIVRTISNAPRFPLRRNLR